jgi:DNA-directed RNA polymerase specialized sigma24 family protein
LEPFITSAAWLARQDEFASALGIAEKFLSRWEDGFTRTHFDDIGMQSAILAVESWNSLREKRRFPSFVRTITRRRRASMVRESMRRRLKGREVECVSCDDFAEMLGEPRWYSVSGVWISHTEMMRALPDVLRQLSELNVRILLSFYEGFSCAELAARFDLTIDSVKMRIYRSRRRVRGIFELLAAAEKSELRIGPLPHPHGRLTQAEGRQPQRSETCE